MPSLFGPVYREQVQGVSQWIVDEFDSSLSRIEAFLTREHNTDGTHKRGQTSGAIFVSSATTNVAGASGQETLRSYTVNPGVITRNGQAFRVTAWGNFGPGTANVWAYVGGELASVGNLAGSGASAWKFDMLITRTGTAEQHCWATVSSNSRTIALVNRVTSADHAGAIQIDIAGERTGATSMTLEYMSVEVIAAP